jgi:hypothetical protein
MKPILLIHGYSAESPEPDTASINAIYGDLADYLKTAFGADVISINISRYISLNDAVSIFDIARALDRALKQDHPALLQTGFHVIIHSTGALVIRYWLKLFSPKPSPIANLIHLAGANLGSGWAIIGRGQLARWGRFVLQNGAQRGLKVLQALELGSSETIDMHLHFLRPGNRMLEDYQIQEYIIIGTQADVGWFTIPIRYAKEDGSDGTVRVSASNLNFNYMRLVPRPEAFTLGWSEVQTAIANTNTTQPIPAYYQIDETSRPILDRREIPFAIPCNCAHTGDSSGIVSGTLPKTQVHGLIVSALSVPERSPDAWSALVDSFHQATASTYNTARAARPQISNFLVDHRNQYDAHAQVIIRIQDQDGHPVPIDSGDIFFVSEQQRKDTIPIQSLIEDTVVSNVSPNCICFYLRINRFDPSANDWVYRLGNVQDFALEITAIEPATPNHDPSVAYVPLRLPLSADKLAQWVQAHRSTIIDVTLVRLPAPQNYIVATV